MAGWSLAQAGSGRRPVTVTAAPFSNAKIRLMRTRVRRCTVAFLLCALIVPLRPALAQRSSPSRVREFLSTERRLTPPEVAEVVEAASEYVAGRPFRLTTAPGVGLELMLDAHGHLRFARDLADRSVVNEYTGRAARHCDDGALATGELAVEYRYEDGEWTAAARLVGPTEPGLAFAALLSGYIKLEDAGLTADRRARGFRSSSKPPETQTLFVDVRSALPLRWEAADERGERLSYSIEYDSSLDLWPPRGVPVPECIERS